MRSAPQLQEIVAEPGAALGLDRDARSPQLLDLPSGASAQLRGLSVVDVGLGSVGMHGVDRLARLGVARLLLVDPARVKAESLLTHPCFPGDVSRPKVMVAGERAAALSPETTIHAFMGAFESLPDAALAGADFVMLAGDNLAVELAVAQRALHLGIPVIQGSVYGPTLSAQVRALTGTAEGDGPCAACLFQAQEWKALDRGVRFSCVGSAAANAPAEPTREPTVSPPQLCALAADLAVTELMSRALGIPGAQGSRLVDFCGYNYQTCVSPLERDASCPLDHDRLGIELCDGDLGERTPRELLGAAGYGDADLRRVTLRVEGCHFVRLAACGCDPHPRVGAFVPVDAHPEPCPDCGGERAPQPVETWRDVLAGVLEAGLDRRLADLGGGAASSVRIRGERGGTLFVRRSST